MEAIGKELSEILNYGWGERSLVFVEGFLHIFIEKAICIPNMVFLKLLVFLFIGSPASATAVIFSFRIERLFVLLITSEIDLQNKKYLFKISLIDGTLYV